MEDTPGTTYNARLSEPLDQEIIKKIGRLRQASDAYLDKALGQKQFQHA
jgi:hypothetical protein